MNSSQQGSKVTVQFRTMDGRTVKVVAGLNWTIKELKDEYGRIRGTEFSNLNMHYRGKRLKDTDLVSSYNFDPEGFVQVVQRSAGGF